MPAHRHIRIPVLGKAAPPIGSDFVSLEAASGIVLLLAAAAALVWANADTAGYTSWWHHELTIGPGDLAITESLVHWVNDALMTIFFFVVGLEIKRELVTGELRDRSRAALPAVAAIGGMVVPALVYVAVNAGGNGLDGWAIPMATDIAFAVGVLALLGSRVPTEPEAVPAHARDRRRHRRHHRDRALLLERCRAAGGCSPRPRSRSASSRCRDCASTIRSRTSCRASLLWWCLHEAGVEPTLAGVVLGLLTPAHPRRGKPVLEQLETALHPMSSFVIVPIFALANAGVVLSGDAIDHALVEPGDPRHRRRSGGGQVRRHPRGVGARGAHRDRRAARRRHLRHVAGVAVLGGIGFTVSLFITDLAFRGVVIDDAKIGVLGGVGARGVDRHARCCASCCAGRSRSSTRRHA